MPRRLAVLSIESGGKMTDSQLRNCKLAFKCDAKWGDLAATGRSKIRFCNDCQQEVHRCETDEELLQAIRSNLCVAIPAPYADTTNEEHQVLIGSTRARPRPPNEDGMPTLKYVMSMTEYEWSIWVKNQTPAVIEHLKKLVSLAPPNAARARQIKAL